MLVSAFLLSTALSQEPPPSPPPEEDEFDPRAAKAAEREETGGGSGRLAVTFGRAFTGKILDRDAFAEAELHGSTFLSLSALFGCSDLGCVGFALPIAGVRATSTDFVTGVETELSTTTLTPSLRLAYTAARASGSGLGVIGYFDLGYMVSVGGNVTARGFALGLAGDVEYWFKGGIAATVGVGLSGSPYSVLHYPSLRFGGEYRF